MTSLLRCGSTFTMPLDAFQNTFAGNPLDRASDRRSKPDWIAGQLASPESLGFAVWNGRPFVEPAKDGGMQIAYLPAKMVGELAGGPERLLFMGLWKETAVFAVDLEGPAKQSFLTSLPARCSHRMPILVTVSG